MCAVSIICIILTACDSSKKMKVGPQDFIRIGNGGGFAGKEHLTIVKDDGQIISSEGVKYRKVKKDVLTQWNSNIEVLGLKNLEYNLPGNLYNFIEIPMADKFIRMSWDPGSTDVPASLKLFYNNIQSVIKNLRDDKL